MNSDNSINEERSNGSSTVMQAVETRPEDNREWQATATPQKAVESGSLVWLKPDEIDEMQSRWNSIQTEFVDEPRACVEHATSLIAEALERVERAFSSQRMTIDNQWIDRDDVSTEDLRVSLQAYRSFLNRLLAL